MYKVQQHKKQNTIKSKATFLRTTSSPGRARTGLLILICVAMCVPNAGWWNGYLSLQFLEYHFGARADMSQPILLLWDNFSGHWTKEVVSYANSINVVLLKVPPSATSVS
jgi:hypothetical protein